MEDPDFLLNQAFDKVVNQSLTRRNPGLFAKCCLVFFTRAKRKLADSHSEVVWISDWIRNNKIDSLESFKMHWNENYTDTRPTINQPLCKTQLKLKENENECLRKRIVELEKELESKDTLLKEIDILIPNIKQRKFKCMTCSKLNYFSNS